MGARSLSIGIFATVGLLCSATAARAANETWVSGTGTDAGNCPRTAPCRTFQFAHDQTNNNGAINVLSSGNFGPLIITKPVSIVADGVEAVINTAAGGPGENNAGIVVRAGPAAIVSLRGLTIDMRGTSNMGIVFESGGALHVRDTIVRKSSRGLEFLPGSGNPELYVSDSVFADSSDTGFDAKRGQVTLDRVRVENSASNGVTFSTGSVAATVRDSVSSGNGLVGIRADAGATVTMERTASLNNGTNGIEALNPGSTIRIGASTVTGNGTGLFPNGGEIISYGTNKVDGNTIDGAPTSTIPMK